MDPILESPEVFTGWTGDQIIALMESVDMIRDDIHYSTTCLMFLTGMCIVYIAFYFLKR